MCYKFLKSLTRLETLNIARISVALDESQRLKTLKTACEFIFFCYMPHKSIFIVLIPVSILYLILADVIFPSNIIV